ncbi:uncharacterized protein [Amphiura filiformis]|uniref:uncharacterized protein n=1 Tax=Amphiura filiformis TaxID=82378 RepID=UPI003B20BAB4
MKYILIFGLLAVYFLNFTNACGSKVEPPEEPDCCVGHDGETTAPSEYPESDSPAGGPSSNPNAAVCYFYRDSNCLVCSKGADSQKCCTKPGTGNDDEIGGPTPKKEYLIGQFRRNWVSWRLVDWHNLYPKKNDNSGYWPYNVPNEDGRSLIGLHPGSVTQGCVTVTDDTCWDAINEIVSNGYMTYTGTITSNYDGFLYVI